MPSDLNEESAASHDPPSRIISSILSSFPWFTNAITQMKHFSGQLGSSTPFEPFLRRIDKFEEKLYGWGGYTTEIMDLQRILGIHIAASSATGPDRLLAVVHPNENPLKLSSLNKKQANSLWHAYIIYRLIDELAWREQAPNSPPPKSVPRTQLPKSARFDLLDRLNIWPNILIDFRAEMMETPSAKLAPFQSNTCFRLFHYLQRTQSLVKKNIILTNLLIAAIHIEHLRSERSESVPDLPKTVRGLLLLESDEHSVQKHEVDKLMAWYSTSIRSDAGKGADLSSGISTSFRHPLHLALCISPLFLLLPVSLAKVHLPQLSIIQCAVALGNTKCELLLRCERLILGALLTLSEGLVDPEELAQNLCNQLPWQELHADNYDKTWFNLDSPISLTVGQLLPPHADPSGPGSALTSHTESTTVSAHFQSSNLQGSRGQFDEDENEGNGDDDDNDTPGDQGPGMISNNANSDKAGFGDETPPTKKSTSNDQRDDAGEDVGESMNVDNDGLLTGKSDANNGDNEGRQALTIPVEKTPASNARDANRPGEGEPEQNMPPLESDSPSELEDEDAMNIDKRKHIPSMKPLPQTSKPTGIRKFPQAPASKKRKRPSKKTSQLKRYELTAKSVNPSDQASSDEQEPSGEEKKTMPPIIPFNLLGGFHKHDPIDVDAVLKTIPMDARQYWPAPPADLESISAPKINMGSPVALFGPEGTEYEFEPSMHDNESLNSLTSFISAIKKDYVNDKPRFLSQPDESGLKVIPYHKYAHMSMATMQALLDRYQCLVVMGMPTQGIAFDEAGLRALKPLCCTIEVSDLSVPSTGDGTERIKRARVAQLLEAAQHEDGKILNALDLPMESAPIQPYPIYASNLFAWGQTTGEPGFKSQTLPITHLRWGLAATKGAWTCWHVDANGVGTHLDVMAGAKVWIFERDTDEHWKNPRTSLADSLVLERARSYPVEAILLRPGTRLIMRPNVVHAVFTPDHTICYGGHFYATSTMQHSLSGTMQAFVAHFRITNTNHVPISLMLRRMALFYYLGLIKEEIPLPESEHLPDIKTVDGILNLLSLCWLVIMGNVLDPRTYSAPNRTVELPADDEDNTRLHAHDFNDIPIDERLNMSYARGICYSLVHWIDAHYIIKDVAAPFKEHNSFGAEFLAKESAKFIAFARLGNSAYLIPLGQAELSAVVRQIENVMQDQFLASAWEKYKDHTRKRKFSLGWNAEERASVTVVRRDTPLEIEDIEDFGGAGTTSLDQKRLLYAAKSSVLLSSVS